MFEQETKERVRKLEESQVLGVYDNEIDYERDLSYNNGEIVGYEEGFQDGAEFGYNKANEWHYVKDGDLPKNNMQVLVRLKNKRLKISVFMENKFTIWNKDYDTYIKLYDVIAWKEIVPPKDIK